MYSLLLVLPQQGQHGMRKGTHVSTSNTFPISAVSKLKHVSIHDNFSLGYFFQHSFSILSFFSTFLSSSSTLSLHNLCGHLAQNSRERLNSIHQNPTVKKEHQDNAGVLDCRGWDRAIRLLSSLLKHLALKL